MNVFKYSVAIVMTMLPLRAMHIDFAARHAPLGPRTAGPVKVENGHLDLSGRNLQSLVGIETLENYQMIRTINISNNDLRTDALLNIQWPPHVEYINVQHNKLSIFPTAAIARLPKNCYIDVSHNTIQDPGCECTVGQRHIIVDLSYNNVSAADLEIIKNRVTASSFKCTLLQKCSDYLAKPYQTSTKLVSGLCLAGLYSWLIKKYMQSHVPLTNIITLFQNSLCCIFGIQALTQAQTDPTYAAASLVLVAPSIISLVTKSGTVSKTTQDIHSRLYSISRAFGFVYGCWQAIALGQRKIIKQCTLHLLETKNCIISTHQRVR